MMRKLGVVLGLASALAAHDARASSCFVAIATTSTGDLPRGCPVTVVIDAPGDPQVFALREGVGTVEVTGAVQETATDIDLWFVGLNEPCAPDSESTQTVSYRTLTIDLAGAQEGDVLSLGGFGFGTDLGTVVAAGACPAAPPAPESITCDVSQPCFPEDEEDQPTGSLDGAGCSTGHGSGFAVIAVLGLLLASRGRLR